METYGQKIIVLSFLAILIVSTIYLIKQNPDGALFDRISKVESQIEALQNQPPPESPALGATFQIPSTVALFETSLASKISPTATSMSLVNSLDITGTSLASSTYGFIIDEGTVSQEMVSADCTGTVCTNMSRGLSPITGTTTVTALEHEHRRGASVKITNGPILLILNRLAQGVDVYPNVLGYKSTVSCSVSSSNKAICPKDYIDAQVSAGAADANLTTKGLVEIATQLEAASSTTLGATGAYIAIGAYSATDTRNAATAPSRVLMSNMLGYLSQAWIDLSASFAWTGAHTFASTVGITGTTTLATTTQSGVNFGADITNTYTAGEAFTGTTTPQAAMIATSTGNIFKVQSSVASTSNFIGFVVNVAPAAGTAYVQTDGIVGGFTGLVTGAPYYVTDTAGVINTTPGTSENFVGIAVSATQILVNRGFASGWQYLGSQSITTSAATVINQPFARYAVIDATVGGTNCTGENDVTIMRVGKTAGTVTEQSAVGSTITCSATYTWTHGGTTVGVITNSVSASAAPTQSATAYYYR